MDLSDDDNAKKLKILDSKTNLNGVKIIFFLKFD